MAMVTLPALMTYPEKFWPLQATAILGIAIDASGEKAAHVFQIPKTGSITKCGYFVNAITTAQLLKIGLYTVDASGNPTTTAYGGMVAATQNVSGGTGFYEVTLSTPATATAGDRVAMVIEFDSTAGNLTIGYNYVGTTAYWGMPNTQLYTTSWGKNSTRVPLCSVGYDDATHPQIAGAFPFSGANADSFTTGNSRGVKINLPFKFRIAGLFMYVDTANGDIVFSVLNSAFASLSSVTVDKDFTSAGATTWYVLFPTPVICEANTDYYFEYTSASTTVLYFMSSAAGLKSATPGGTGYVRVVNRVAATDTVPLSGILIDQVDVSAAGGLIVHPGMTGGMRG